MAGSGEWRGSAKVVEVARPLGFRGAGDAADYVVRYCRDTVQRWIDELRPSSLEDLLATVTTRAGLRIEEFQNDAELSALCGRYLRDGELVFAQVKNEFDDETFALTVRLRQPKHGCTHVAVIDCRGRRAQKRWFSIWHEVAHLLVDRQLAMAFRRCELESKDPVERLMDAIAGELAFHEAWFGGELAEVSLSALEAHRKQKAPESSRQAAYGAAIAASSVPVLFVVAEPALKAAQKRAKRQPELFSVPHVDEPLRAVAIIQSKGARELGLFIPRNMRVPESSIIKRMFEGERRDLDEETQTADEDLSEWTDSRGSRLPGRCVRVEAGKSGAKVFALVSVVEGEAHE